MHAGNHENKTSFLLQQQTIVLEKILNMFKQGSPNFVLPFSIVPSVRGRFGMNRGVTGVTLSCDYNLTNISNNISGDWVRKYFPAV